jgi:hypothetical protein
MGDHHITLINQVVLIPARLVNEIRSMCAFLIYHFEDIIYTKRPCRGVEYIQFCGCGFEVNFIEVHVHVNPYHEMKKFET